MTTICVQYGIRTTVSFAATMTTTKPILFVGSSKRELDIPTVTVSSEKLPPLKQLKTKTKTWHRKKIKFCVAPFVVSDINFHHPT
jgi:hypothetical protein